MAGDTLRDAFRSRLTTHLAAATACVRGAKDVVNTTENPDAAAPGFIYLEFLGGSERQYTFGSPGSNLHREEGQVTLRIASPLGNLADRNTGEADAEKLRGRFRMDRFAAGTQTVRIVSVDPMGGGIDEAGLWVESIALNYETYVSA